MRKNLVQPGRPQMTIWRMRITYWITKATNTYSECVILIDFPLQQWLHERASLSALSNLHVMFSTHLAKLNVTTPCRWVSRSLGLTWTFWASLLAELVGDPLGPAYRWRLPVVLRWIYCGQGSLCRNWSAPDSCRGGQIAGLPGKGLAECVGSTFGAWRGLQNVET